MGVSLSPHLYWPILSNQDHNNEEKQPGARVPFFPRKDQWIYLMVKVTDGLVLFLDFCY